MCNIITRATDLVRENIMKIAVPWKGDSELIKAVLGTTSVTEVC
jgi:hypothetical protein